MKKEIAFSVLAFLSICLIAWNFFLTRFMASELHMNDFGKFYYSAAGFLKGKDLYAPNAATLLPVTESQNLSFLNMNPPHFHLFLLPLAILPPAAALAVWIAASLMSLVISWRLIIKEVRLRMNALRILCAAVFILAFSGTGAFFATGQMSLLLLLPVTLAWIQARRGHWTRAGIYLGIAISLKPFLAIFLLYLLLCRRYKSAAVTMATAVSCFAVGAMVFGLEALRSWLQVLSTVDWAWAAMNASVLGILTRSLSYSPYYSPAFILPSLITPLWIGLAGIVGLVTLAVSAADRHDSAIDRSFALLLLGAILISPVGWVYYFFLFLGPVFALTIAWHQEFSKSKIHSPKIKAVILRHGLLMVAVPGLFFPFSAVLVNQPAPLATISIGSVYFWTALLAWSSLLLDWGIERKALLRRSTEEFR